MNSTASTIRLCVTVKDVMNITGKSERAARITLRKIRIAFGKEPRAEVTVFEYCRHMNLTFDEYRQFLTSTTNKDDKERSPTPQR